MLGGAGGAAAILRRVCPALVAIGSGLILSGPALAADEPAAKEMEAVVVTAPGVDGPDADAVHNISVITAEDINRSGASSVAELISREANLTLQSFYGSDKKAGVGMRGMGETAASNVLILVDGMRLNEYDLAGADLSAVPLSRIERIEVIRGGGVVRYGDGAVAGVINLITRRPRAGPLSLDFEHARGSYGMDDTRMRLGGGSGPLAFSVDLSQLDTEGFRDNGDLRTRNASGELRLSAPGPLNFLDAFVRLDRHTDQHGFPGPVSAADFASGTAARRSTKTPFDRGETEDRVWTAGLGADFKSAGRLALQASYRQHANDFILNYSPTLPASSQLSTIASKRRDLQLRYDNELNAFGMTQELSFGVSAQSADYGRYANGREVPELSKRNLGELDGQAAFAALTLRPDPHWTLHAGLRKDRTRSRFSKETYTRDCRFIPIPFPPFVMPGGCTPYAYKLDERRDAVWDNHGSELGLSWQAWPHTTLYASVTHQFRSPNLDELALASTDLRPQSGRTVEGGARARYGEALSWDLALFRMVNHDEIYLSAVPAINRNYDLPTRRTGAEFAARWRATNSLSMRTNLGWVAPRFVGVDADIPHVPRRTANAQVEWRTTEWASLTLALRYVGRRFDGNDFTNRALPPLPHYLIVDTALRIKLGAAELMAGINNLTDRAYSTLAFSATYYPMPERNGFVRLRVSF